MLPWQTCNTSLKKKTQQKKSYQLSATVQCVCVW